MSQASDKSLKLVGDAFVAEQLNIARATIRVQRHLRRCGKPHWLELEPYFVGNRPKYFVHDVDALLKKLLESKSGRMGGQL